jgi:hypothetical protein
MSNPDHAAIIGRKKPQVVFSALAVWLVLFFFIVLPWIHRFDRFDMPLSVLAHLSAFAWWLVLLWAFHHLAFQICGLFSRVSLLRRLA